MFANELAFDLSVLEPHVRDLCSDSGWIQISWLLDKTTFDVAWLIPHFIFEGLLRSSLSRLLRSSWLVLLARRPFVGEDCLLRDQLHSPFIGWLR